MKIFHCIVKVGGLAVVMVFLSASLVSAQGIQASPCPWGSFELLRIPNQSSDICQLLAGSNNDGKVVFGLLASNITMGITALVMMAAAVGIVIGGYIYMTAGGSADRVQVAKAWITAALLGIVIALTAWVVLYTIQPAFVI